MKNDQTRNRHRGGIPTNKSAAEKIVTVRGEYNQFANDKEALKFLSSESGFLEILPDEAWELVDKIDDPGLVKRLRRNHGRRIAKLYLGGKHDVVDYWFKSFLLPYLRDARQQQLDQHVEKIGILVKPPEKTKIRQHDKVFKYIEELKKSPKYKGSTLRELFSLAEEKFKKSDAAIKGSYYYGVHKKLQK